MAKTPPEAEIYRTRLFLVTPPDYRAETFAPVLEKTLSGGDAASLLILPPSDGDYREAAERLVPIAQAHGVAALLYNDSRLMGRTKADGLHLDGPLEEIVETVKAHAGRNIMGIGNIATRHDAMTIGEGPVDYLFFGRLDGDTNASIFPKTFKLAEWWSSVMSVPAVVMGGNGLESVDEAAAAGIDFLALRNLIFQADDPRTAMIEANRLLDRAFETRKAEHHG